MDVFDYMTQSQRDPYKFYALYREEDAPVRKSIWRDGETPNASFWAKNWADSFNGYIGEGQCWRKATPTSTLALSVVPHK